MKLIECVPNFSEGRDRDVIDAIAASIEAVEGVMLLDVDPGEATNRTVMTFVGEPGPVEEAAFAAIATAARLIDMASHSGEHPRMGATDVCPFVPMDGATMDDCVVLARRLVLTVPASFDAVARELTAQAAQMAGQWMQYTPGATNINDVLNDQMFASMAMRGMSPAQFAQTVADPLHDLPIRRRCAV